MTSVFGMVERILSGEREVAERYRKVGVVVFVFNNREEILLLEERGKAHDTDGARIGDFSVICETANHGEDWAENIVRGIQEELGTEVLESGRFAVDTQRCFIGESVFGPDVLARVAVLHYMGNPNDIFSATGDGEVAVVGWQKQQELLNYPLRSGVRKILEECIKGGHFKNIARTQNQLVPLSLDSLRATGPTCTVDTNS